MVQGGGPRPGPAEGGRRPTEDGPGLIGKGPKRFSARRKVELVLRLLRGEDLELLSRELGVTAVRLSQWREQVLKAGRAVLKKRPQDARDLNIALLHQKLEEVTMANELLQKKIEHLEDGRPLPRRRLRRRAGPPRPPPRNLIPWSGSAGCGAWGAPPSTGNATPGKSPPSALDRWEPVPMRTWCSTSKPSWPIRPFMGKVTAKCGPGCGMPASGPPNHRSCV